MIKILRHLLVAICIFLYSNIFVFAHPGRTASDGMHYCRTNCDRWGEVWGARHSHGGSFRTYNPPPKKIIPYETPEQKNVKCNRKYSGTIYQLSDDKCVCQNGKPYDEYRQRCPVIEVIKPPSIKNTISNTVPGKMWLTEQSHDINTLDDFITSKNKTTLKYQEPVVPNSSLGASLTSSPKSTNNDSPFVSLLIILGGIYLTNKSRLYFQKKN